MQFTVYGMYKLINIFCFIPFGVVIFDIISFRVSKLTISHKPISKVFVGQLEIRIALSLSTFLDFPSIIAYGSLLFFLSLLLTGYRKVLVFLMTKKQFYQ